MTTFKDRIRVTLDQRDVIIPPLVALSEELPKGWGQRDVQELIDLLRDPPDVNTWLEHPRAAAWLPVIVGSSVAAEAPQRMSSLLVQTMQHRARNRRRAASLMYPLVVLGLAGLVGVGMCWFVVPTFAHMHREFGLTMAAPTAFTIWCSDLLLQQPFQLLLFAIVAVAIAIGLVRWGLRSAFVARYLGLKGSAGRVQAIATSTGAIADLLSIGAPLPWALRIAGRGCEHPLYQDKLAGLANASEASGTAWQQSEAATWFPVNLRLALQAAADGRPNVELLRDLATMYHERAALRVDWLRWLVGPIALLAVGVMVAFIVISLFMPFVSLITGLS